MKNKNGFTLIEIVVVICLIAGLMAATIPGVMNYFSDVEDNKLLSEAESVVAVAKNYATKISLSGTYGTETSLTKEKKDELVAKAKGHGEIISLSYNADTQELENLVYLTDDGRAIKYIKGQDLYFD